MTRTLYVILAAYVVLAAIYSVVTPIFEASDELWHYPMVQYIATHSFQLPPQVPGTTTDWRQEGSQPPLYYLMSAAITAPIDTSDLDVIRRQNPHADIGVIRPDGNVNMMVHHTDLEAFPWHGTVLAVHIARFLSIALGFGTVLVTFLLARELFPKRPEIALGAAALNAFLPMFLFISGSVNNDNLSNLLGNLLTLLIVRLIKVERQPRYRSYIVIGFVAGAGMLAKLSFGFLIPLVALALLLVTLRFRNWRPLIFGGLISGGLTIVIAGWWYLRNQQLYGDPTGLSVFLALVGRRAELANLAQLWAERSSFTQAFWGFFGGVNVALPDVIYLIFNGIAVIGIVGAVAFIVYKMTHKGVQLNAPTRYLPHAVTLLWIAITFVSYLRWTAETPASQGRLIFVALSSILIWLLIGWTWWLPQRIRPILVGGLALFFFAVSAITPFAVIAPVYALPSQAADETPKAVFSGDDGALTLLDAHVLSTSVQPDQYLQIEMDWQIEAPLHHNWSVFVHLTTLDGVIVGQRDVYPGEGKLATSDLDVGYSWQNPLAIYVPPAAYAPETLTIDVGWYDLETGERLKLTDGSETFAIGTVDLKPRPSDLGVPNPLSINFDHQIELVGYEISTLTPKAGESTDLTLYWRALQPLNRDYTVFAHILDPQTTSIYAGSDATPGGSPTSGWKVGEIIKDVHTLAVNADAPPGIYEVEIGLYLNAGDGSFPRLNVIAANGGGTDNFAHLSRVRVLPREDGS